jgi:hypothetical protein
MNDSLPTRPTRQKLAIEGRSRRGAVTGKLKAALEAMVWEGARRPDAAEPAGLADDSKNDMAKVGAIKALEQIADTADEKRQHGIPGQLPGLQIVIAQGSPRPEPVDLDRLDAARLEIIRP